MFCVKSSFSPNYKTALTLRYLFALSLIMMVMLFAYFFLIGQTQTNREDAHIINISGKQRMLSQRIALMAREIYHAKSQDKADLYFNKFIEAVDTMKSDHVMLFNGSFHKKKFDQPLSNELKHIYFDEKGIEERINEYLAYASQLEKIYQTKGWNAVRQTDVVEKITAIARNGLLDKLNEAVEQYEREAQARVDRFKFYETVILLTGLSLLLMEALFIFSPMVRQIVSRTEELENSNKELREFTYRISHDLRAPVISSIGLVNTAKTTLEAGDVQNTKTGLSLILSSMEKLDNLIEDIINLTKLKMVEMEKESVSLSSLIDDSVQKLRHLPNADKVAIHKIIDVDRSILIEKLYLQQTIENLLSNAIKYADFQKSRPYIKINAEVNKGNLLITIRDNGIGIPPESQENMFGMFKRFHPRVSFGSGLGLYLVAQNIEKLNGKISCIHHEDGSEFQIKIPIQHKS